MVKVRRIVCGKCHSKRTMVRAYIRWEKPRKGFRPVGWLCTRCEVVTIIQADLRLPPPKRPRILVETEPIIFSGSSDRRGDRGMRGYVGSPLGSGVSDQDAPSDWTD